MRLEIFNENIMKKKLVLFLFIILLFVTKSYSQKTIDLEYLLESIISKDTNSAKTFIRKFTNVKESINCTPYQCEINYDDLGLRFTIPTYLVIDRVTVRPTPYVIFKNNKLNDEIDFQTLISIFDLTGKGQIINNFNKIQTILSFEGKFHDKLININVISPKVLFHSNIICEKISKDSLFSLCPPKIKIESISYYLAVDKDVETSSMEAPPSPPMEPSPFTSGKEAKEEFSRQIDKITNLLESNKLKEALIASDNLAYKYPYIFALNNLRISLHTNFGNYQKAIEISQNQLKTPDGNTPLTVLNLQELYLLNKEFNKLLSYDLNIDFFSKNEERFLWNMHRYFANILLNKSVKTDLENLNEAKAYVSFKKYKWSFNSLKDMISKSSFSVDKKNHLKDIIKELEKL